MVLFAKVLRCPLNTMGFNGISSVLFTVRCLLWGFFFKELDCQNNLRRLHTLRAHNLCGDVLNLALLLSALWFRQRGAKTQTQKIQWIIINHYVVHIYPNKVQSKTTKHDGIFRVLYEADIHKINKKEERFFPKWPQIPGTQIINLTASASHRTLCWQLRLSFTGDRAAVLLLIWGAGHNVVIWRAIIQRCHLLINRASVKRAGG